MEQVEELRRHLSRMKDPGFLTDMGNGSGPIGFRAIRD
jgi:hypothetical protein